LVGVYGDEGFARRLDTPLVGRATELSRLRSAFAQAQADRSCQLFTILGSAGVGKSRLAAEFLTSLDDAVVARGRCLPYGEGITYWPVVEVVKQLPRATLDPPIEHGIRVLLGEEEGAAREENARAFRKLLESVARERPSSASSTTSTGARRRSSTFSSTSPTSRATPRSCFSASRGPSCSTPARAGRAGRSTVRACSSSLSVTPRLRRCSRASPGSTRGRARES
jgi:hypothetical protein